jgi:sulfite reductase alpha subunit-like flavoprotein
MKPPNSKFSSFLMDQSVNQQRHNYHGVPMMSPSVLILYGSETGTAEEVAFRLHTMMGLCPSPIADADTTANRSLTICSMDDYEVTRLPAEQAIVFVVSTTGDGDVPGSMKLFWSFLLRRGLPLDSLQNISIAVFGLGDSSYEKFNAAARRLSKRLQQLGARELLPIGLGDDQDRYGYFTALDEWSAQLMRVLYPAVPSHLSMTRAANQLPTARYSVEVLQETDCASPAGDSNTRMSVTHLASVLIPPSDAKVHRSSINAENDMVIQTDTQPSSGRLLPIVASVKENRRMTHENWDQDVRHIVLSLPTVNAPTSSSRVASDSDDSLHVAGDVATVYPRNDPALVQRMLALFVGANDTIPEPASGATSLRTDSLLRIRMLAGSIKRKSRLADVPRCTASELFSMLLDIGGIPQRAFFEGLAMHSTHADEKEKLREIASAEGTDLYYDYCIKEKRNYVEVLEDFKSARPALAHLLDLLPVMQPRHYSISNSGRVDMSEVCYGVRSVVVGYCMVWFVVLVRGISIGLYW